MKEGWKYEKLGDVASYVNGFAFKPEDWTNEGLPIIRIQNLTEQNKTFNYCKRTDIPQKYLVTDGDVLISWSATLGVFEWKRGLALLNQHIFKVVFDKIKINKQFFIYTIQTSIEEMSRHTNGATMRHIRKGDFDNIKIPLPSLSEQERIVAFLDAEFEKIDQLKANAAAQLQAAKDLFQAALKEMFTPKEGWTEKKLNEISVYYNGLTYSPSDVSQEGFLVLRSSNIQNDNLSLNDQVRVKCDIKDKLKVHKGDIIMCSRNGSKALVGKVAIIPEEYIDVTFGTFMMIIKSESNPFLYYFFLSDLFKKQIWKGEANMINQITRYMLDEVVITLPLDLNEQIKISTTLNELKFKVQQLQSNYDQTLTLCNDLKQALLKSIFA